MVSIYLRPSVNVALETLRNIHSNLKDTQLQVSTGYRVAKANDNASYWSVATSTRSDISAISAVHDALGLAAATVNVASTSMTSAIDVVSEIKAKLVSATEEGIDKDKINEELTQLKGQLRSIGQAASFNGENWIVVSGDEDPTKPKQVSSSFVRREDGSVSVGTLTYKGVNASGTTGGIGDARYLIDDLSGDSGEYGVLTSDRFAASVGASKAYVLLSSEYGNTSGQTEIALNAATTTGEVAQMISTVDAMLGQMTEVGAAFGSLEDRITLQDNFAQSLNDSLTTGVGKLVDADMETESTRLMALQTQEQLGLQSLSIANASYDTVRQLFQNIH